MDVQSINKVSQRILTELVLKTHLAFCHTDEPIERKTDINPEKRDNLAASVNEKKQELWDHIF